LRKAVQLMAPMGRILVACALLRQALAASMCMDAGSEDSVQVWECNGQPNQQWDLSELHTADMVIRAAPWSHQVLTLPNGDTTNGSPIILEFDCNPFPHHCGDEGHTPQEWTFDADSWSIRYRADPSKCIDAGDMSQGAQPFIWDCNGLSQQKWGWDENAQTIYLVDSRRLQAQTPVLI